MGKAILMVFFVGAFVVFSFIKFAARGVKAAYSAVNEPEKGSVPELMHEAERTKVDKAVDLAILALSLQKAMISHGDEVLPAKACDDWSLGYVGGVTDAILQRMGIDQDDIGGFSVMTLVFMDVYGKEKGPVYFQKFIDLQKNPDSALHSGQKVGGTELFGFCDDSNESPTSLTRWMAYVFEKEPAKKPAAKKAVAKKPTAKKAVAKKPTAKKAVAKKPTAKKAVAKKPTAKKSAVGK